MLNGKILVTSSSMDVLKTLAKLKALKWKLFKYGKIEDIQTQEVDIVFLFILEYMDVVLSRGMQY
jgi:hypothetical protein